MDVDDGDYDAGILSKSQSKYLHELTDVDVGLFVIVIAGRERLVVVGPLVVVGLDGGRLVVEEKLRVVVVI